MLDGAVRGAGTGIETGVEREAETEAEAGTRTETENDAGTEPRAGRRAEAGTETWAETGQSPGHEESVGQGVGRRCLSTSGHTHTHTHSSELPSFPRSNIIICSARKSMLYSVCGWLLAVRGSGNEEKRREANEYFFIALSGTGKELTLKHLSTWRASLHTALVLLSHRLAESRKSLTQTHIRRKLKSLCICNCISSCAS